MKKRKKRKTSTDKFDVDTYQHHDDWKLEEIGIDLCTMLYWLEHCLITCKMSPERTEDFILNHILHDPSSSIRIIPAPGKPGLIRVSYFVSLGKTPGFTCSITELPKLHAWVKQCRSKADVEEKK